MKTAYNPRIASPFQVKQEKSFDVQNKKHPVREEIEKCIGTYNLTAVVEEDLATQTTMKMPGLISFLCTLLKDGRVVSQGRGNSVLNPTNRFLQRAVSSAFNSALADAAIRATKVLDTFRTSCGSNISVALEEAYKTKENVFELATDKQKSYLLELVSLNVNDEDERKKWESQIDEITKDEASAAIQSFKR